MSPWPCHCGVPGGRAGGDTFSHSGYAYTRPEPGTELDMELGEEDVEENGDSGDSGDTESGSIEEERCGSKLQGTGGPQGMGGSCRGGGFCGDWEP